MYKSEVWKFLETEKEDESQAVGPNSKICTHERLEKHIFTARGPTNLYGQLKNAVPQVSQNCFGGREREFWRCLGVQENGQKKIQKCFSLAKCFQYGSHWHPHSQRQKEFTSINTHDIIDRHSYCYCKLGGMTQIYANDSIDHHNYLLKEIGKGSLIHFWSAWAINLRTHICQTKLQ